MGKRIWGTIVAMIASSIPAFLLIASKMSFSKGSGPHSRSSKRQGSPSGGSLQVSRWMIAAGVRAFEFKGLAA